jgi:phenylpropionate dioxygenase-like ring-hydroxylating dioxygenase large terminal subunit
MSDRVSLSEGRRDWGTWPRYEAAVLGLRNYWYPATWSCRVRGKPVPITLLGERIVFIRDRGRVYALHDRCAHRGVPLSLGARTFGQQGCSRQEFAGTLSCGYHGWTYDLASGTLVAALTDGPDSPICGKVRVRTYPVEERIGIVWVYIGELDPPPVEADIPEELLAQPHTKGGRISIREGNWRYAAENGFDEAHPRYLHQNSAWLMRQQIPGWTRSGVKMLEDGQWLAYYATEVHRESEYPGLGRWPPQRWWKQKGRGGARVAIRLPCMLRVNQFDFAIYSWFMPQDENHHRYMQLAVKFTTGLPGWLFRVRYWTYIRWLNQVLFTNQDEVMIKGMDAPPERLFRPDLSLVAWRKMCEGARGGEAPPPDTDERDLAALTNNHTTAI